MNSFSPTCIFFDLDDTLYPPSRGVWSEIALRINRYMVERSGIPEPEVDALRKRYFSEFGTTLNGLRAERGVDPLDYYRFVHDLPLERLLEPDPALRTMLRALSQKKFIFSNADRPYILRVLSRLGIADCFDGIIDIFATDFACKPMEASYQIALTLAGSPRPKECALVDDLPRNLKPAAEMGMTAVLVGGKFPSASERYQIDSIYHLADLFA
jgi:putative hydrolase of the HAD superfamily